MKGEAKRDYPASINYQSPWYKQYKYVEDHFARVHTALTRGKPVVRIGVVHPIESYWIHRGPEEQTALVRKQLDENFANTDAFRWLSENAADYGFILRYEEDTQDITMITYEPWHWRYVGVEAAQEIKAQGVTLEEYLGMD